MTSSTPSAALRRMRAVIFDMDGVLIDTEPVWRAVEMERFGSVGVELTDADCRATMGLRVDEVVRRWFERRPWTGISRAEMVSRIVDGMVERVRADGEAMPGAPEALRMVRDAGLLCAVASSSPTRLIAATLDRLGMRGAVDAVCSAETELRGKPAPDVYRRTATTLGVPPDTCLAVEDSVNGVLSARAAGMPCVVIPDPGVATDPQMAVATLRLGSLREFDLDRLRQLAAAYFE